MEIYRHATYELDWGKGVLAPCNTVYKTFSVLTSCPSTLEHGFRDMFIRIVRVEFECIFSPSVRTKMVARNTLSVTTTATLQIANRKKENADHDYNRWCVRIRCSRRGNRGHSDFSRSRLRGIGCFLETFADQLWKFSVSQAKARNCVLETEKIWWEKITMRN